MLSKYIILLFLFIILFSVYISCNVCEGLMKKKFITFGAGGDTNTNFEEAVKRIVNQAKSLKVFDEVIGYTEKDLKGNFWDKHGNFIQSNSRGYGYWIWKPYLILKTLEEMNDGDILVYADSGCEINSKKREEMLKLFQDVNDDLLIASYTAYEEKKYTKKDVFLHFQMDNPKYKNSIQHAATTMCILKCDKTYEFVKEWYDNCYYSLIDDSNYYENDDEFVENRHDQSIFSLLTKQPKYNFQNMSITNAIEIMWNRTGNSLIE